MGDVKIKDLYAGKPDAKDEINFEGMDTFIKTFVAAEHFNLDSLINGSHCFITGFKGTGKTALLFYLEDRIKANDPISCTSYIFFKEEYTDVRKRDLQDLSQRILSSISVEEGALVDNTEFEYIWRWIFYKQIVRDNEEYNRNLFVDDENWKRFEKIVNQIRDPRNSRKFMIPNKIKFAIPCKDATTFTEVSPEVEVDLRNVQSENYREFVNLIDHAESALSSVEKTDIPYYILIDELEAYYGDTQIFKRDLYMIRDLIFTVKRLNTIFSRSGMGNVKAICSVRSEIINAISRFIVTKEVNKVISGFSIPLNWNYSNNNSHAHPIIQIILKRIALCEGIDQYKSLEIYRKWFPELIHGLEPASYILNNSWYKPRDMIRLLMCAKNSMHNGNSAFTGSVFDSIAKTYSDDSLQEIKEELRALYTSEEIDCIVSCFTGFKTVFSISELQNRIKKIYAGTVLEVKFVQVLNDLYRLGFIGNFLPASKTYHWQHRGDSALIMSDEWRVCIHYALHGALAIGSRNDFGLKRGQEPQKGDVAIATVKYANLHYAKVEFYLYGILYSGQIHISEFGKREKRYIKSLPDLIAKGEEIRVSIDEYNEQYGVWNLRIAELIEDPNI
ncbi:MAG: hypothetical protein PUJ55_04295 [Clostridiales bacterium]|nr:hypothetical protein [Roseburia sp.]MDD7636144.1 hypothetical protein [Clostridiales bacterium]MDY4112743.1 hypothetical protein [Roseburia sp.]